ncbi:MAG TPA: trans-aconitate 2-methyltransferase [Alphaproteobacteria bacterium]
MTEWSPSQYLKFADERTRPAADLLARVPLAAPAAIVDLGCGPGNSTELLARRWPDARLIGVDSSAAMLAQAASDHPEWIWEQADIAVWSPAAPVDLIFANAALHWVPDHGTLLPRLFGHVASGGALAVQMPRNFDAPSHALMRRVADAPRWRRRLAGVVGRPVAEPAAYYDLLAPLARRLDLWESEYMHVLDGVDAILEWVRGTGLRPYLDPLDPAEREAFTDRYLAALADAYPRAADGKVLFPFKRLFLVAMR